MSLHTTASQTVGPYLHIGLTWLVTDNLVAPGVAGTPISLQVRVTDGDGKPVNDALVEIWQANSHGRYAHPDDMRDLPLEAAWKGFGRVPTDEDGRFRFTTIKPGRVPAPGGGLQAPHINVTIFMRGLLKHLTTRIYFDGDPANAEDAVLQGVPAARRGTLLARAADGNAHALQWDVRLQGEGETVFFEY
jgi:protocatechuate 3,4-dioxygenase alpha subunit